VEFQVILIGLQKCKHWRKWVWSRRKIACKGNPFPSHTSLIPVVNSILKLVFQYVVNKNYKWIKNYYKTYDFKCKTYHAAPTTDKEIASPIPRLPHMNGEVFSSILSHCTAYKLNHQVNLESVTEGSVPMHFTSCLILCFFTCLGSAFLVPGELFLPISLHPDRGSKSPGI